MHRHSSSSMGRACFLAWFFACSSLSWFAIVPRIRPLAPIRVPRRWGQRSFIWISFVISHWAWHRIPWRRRKDYAHEAEEAIRVLDKADDPKTRAAGLLARGDLNWQLSNFPKLPTTRPESNPDRTYEEYLKASEDAYSQVLQPPFNEDHASVTTARFNLAAIAENRGQWDKAAQSYQQIVDDTLNPQEFKDLARKRLENLKTLEKPVVLGSPVAPETVLQMPNMPNMPKVPLGPAAPVVLPTQPASTLPAGLFPSSAPSGATLPAAK